MVSKSEEVLVEEVYPVLEEEISEDRFTAAQVASYLDYREVSSISQNLSYLSGDSYETDLPISTAGQTEGHALIYEIENMDLLEESVKEIEGKLREEDLREDYPFYYKNIRHNMFDEFSGQEVQERKLEKFITNQITSQRNTTMPNAMKKAGEIIRDILSEESFVARSSGLYHFDENVSLD